MNLTQKARLFQWLTIVSVSGLAIISYLYFTTDPQAEVRIKNTEGESVNLSPQDIEALYQFNADLAFDNEEIQKQWRDNKEVRPETGDWVTTVEAEAKMTNFTTWNTRRFNFRKEISPRGFAFGLKRLKELTQRIDSVNTNILTHEPDELKIQGVRIYLTFSKIQSNRTRHLDLMMIPVLGNGNDYINLSTKSIATIGDEMILNTSSPCPDNCPQTGNE